MRSSKPGREIHCFNPWLTLLTRVASDTGLSSDFDRRNLDLTGEVRRDVKDATDLSSETVVMSREARRRKNRVL